MLAAVLAISLIQAAPQQQAAPSQGQTAGPTPESIQAAAVVDRPLLIDARLSADRRALAEATDPDEQAQAALTLSHDLLTLAWARSLAPERVLLGIADADELEVVERLGRELVEVTAPFIGPGRAHRELLPCHAAGLTLLAACGAVDIDQAQAAWQGIDMRRQRSRVVRLAIWSADAAGALRVGSDRLSVLLRHGVPAESWLAQINKRRMLGEGQWPAADPPWQILLLAEASAASMRDPAVGQALMTQALPQLVAAGWSEDAAASVLVDRMVRLPSPPTDEGATALARSAAAAVRVARGDTEAWQLASAGPAAAPWTRQAATRAARSHAAHGETRKAMAAWAAAALAGDAHAAQHAAGWILGLQQDEPDGGVVAMLQLHPDPVIARVASGVHHWRSGDVETAVRDWVSVPPGSRIQAGALVAAAARLGEVDLDMLGASLRRLRTASIMAATDQHDPHRAALARQASGWALAAAIDHAMAQDRIEAAARLLRADPAAVHLSQRDRLRLDAVVALRTGQAEGPLAALAALDPVLARRLLIERALQVMGPDRGLGPEPAPRDVQGLVRVLDLLQQHLEDSTVQHRLLLADARRLAGKGSPKDYRDILDASPNLADAMLGLAEHLNTRSDAASLEEAMGLYRSLASADVAMAPHRWWLAQLRMLQLAQRAGRGLDERQARIARLRHDHPDLGGPRWASAITSSAQSGN